MDAYETHFGLNEPPFSVTPDPRFFYANQGYREAYATLRYGVEARKGFVVVTGEAGTGKTTLLRMLMQSAGSSISTAFIFNPPRQFGELLQMILSELELSPPAPDRVGMLAQFNDYLLEQLGKRRIVALLIDEAQALSHGVLEELRLLSNLETNREKLIQIVLMGQPELEGKLDQPELRQLKQRVALRCRLEPLHVEDISAYIDFRLKTAGYNREPLFDPAGVEKIARYSQGIPRLINVICENVLLRGYQNALSRIPAEMIEEAARELRLDGGPRSSPQPVASPKPATASDSDDHADFADAASASAMKPASGYDFDAFDARETSGPQEFRRRRAPAVLPITVWLAAFLIAATGLALHNSYNAVPVAAPPDRVAGAPRPADVYGSAAAPAREERGPERHVSLSSVHVPLPGSHAGEQAARHSTPRRSGSGFGGSGREHSGGNERDAAPARRSDNRATSAEDREAGSEPPRAKIRTPASRTFIVTDASFVRATPRADAEVTNTLTPGTRILVVGRAGEYFRVRGLDGESASGYVHQEDAFFEPSR